MFYSLRLLHHDTSIKLFDSTFHFLNKIALTTDNKCPRIFVSFPINKSNESNILRQAFVTTKIDIIQRDPDLSNGDGNHREGLLTAMS